MENLLFGTAGTPISTKGPDSVSGIKRVRELGLDCMEIEFVRGVNMGKETAREVREVARDLDVSLSVHGPYYINLNASEEKKVRDSIKRIMDSAKMGAICGARNITFHAAYYLKDQKTTVFSRVKNALEELHKKLLYEEIDVVLRPETTGKLSQFGSLEELLMLSVEVEGVLPCIDFSHLHARRGKNNSKEEFIVILTKIEDSLGRDALEDMHVHISGIEYTDKGERRHLNIEESDIEYLGLLDVWREFDIKGTVISESPNLEGDALLLRNLYRTRMKWE